MIEAAIGILFGRTAAYLMLIAGIITIGMAYRHEIASVARSIPERIIVPSLVGFILGSVFMGLFWWQSNPSVDIVPVDIVPDDTLQQAELGERTNSDTELQAQRREELRQFHRLYFEPATNTLISFNSIVSSELGQDRADLDSLLGGLVRHLYEDDWTPLWNRFSSAVYTSPESETYLDLDFIQFQNLYAGYYAWYSETADWTQRAAKMTMGVAVLDLQGYQEWNDADEEFMDSFKEITTRSELDQLYGRTVNQSIRGGPNWSVFRIRDLSLSDFTP